MISIIVAATNDLVIGANNDIPWYLPTDLKSFKEITKGHDVIMGKNCWESIPEKYRPLPGRVNIVASRNVDYEAVGAIVTNNLEDTLIDARDSEKEIFVIGGSEIYKAAFNYAIKLYITVVNKQIDGDTFFEGYNPEEWEPTSIGDWQTENEIEFRFEEHKRK